MRAELGPIALIGGYCFAGLGVLASLRFIRLSIGSVVAALGLAFMVGVAVVLLSGIALLCVGAPVNIEVLGSLMALIGLGGFGFAWWQASWRRPSWARIRLWPLMQPIRQAVFVVRGADAEHRVAAGVLIVLSVFSVLTYRWARVQPLEAWDAWAIWARKGTLLLDYSHLPTAFFTSPVYAFMHQDYPLLLPLYEASWFRVIGSADTQSLHAWFWVLFVAFLWATAYVSSRVVRPAIWAPLVGLLAVTPEVWTQLMTMYADVPMGLYLMIGVLLLGLWITGQRRRDLVLSMVLLAAAASTKNEGVTAVVSTFAVALIVTLVAPAPGLARRRALVPLLAAIAAFAGMVAPWRLWLAVHHIKGDMPVARGFEPSFLLEHTGRIQPTVNALFSEVTAQSNWYYLLPMGLALVVAGLATPGLRRIAVFYGLATLGAFIMVLWGYVINPNGLGWLIATSASRTVVGPMLIAVAGTFHLAGALLTHAFQCSTPDPSRYPSGHATATQGVGVRLERSE
jgi:hypothetical protein